MQRIEDMHEHASTSNSMCYRNLNKNITLAAEETIVLYLVYAVVKNMKGIKEDKIVIVIIIVKSMYNMNMVSNCN